MEVQAFGSVTGAPVRGVVQGAELLASVITGHGYYTHAYTYYTLGGDARAGDSGAPVYTIPDASGEVRMVGILGGTLGTSDSMDLGGLVFTSWDDVEEALDLKPISAPGSPIEEDEEDEEDEEELAGLFSVFD